jgi:hypothetical protein
MIDKQQSIMVQKNDGGFETQTWGERMNAKLLAHDWSIA